jgi:4-hydroxyacetophenone monooxygenase
MITTRPRAFAGPDGALRVALEEANLPTLLLALATLTGDERWLRGRYVPKPQRGPGDNDSGGFHPGLARSIRADAYDLIAAWRERRLAAAEPPAPERLVAMLETSLGAELPAGSGGLLAEEFGSADRWVDVPPSTARSQLDAVVVGAGLSGILAAIQLARAEVPFTVLEKNEAVGGTWFENSYPGCGVDVPSHLYSYSFAQRADWPRYFATRDQLHDYAQSVATEYDVQRHIRFRHEVVSAEWDPQARAWQLLARDRHGTEQRIVARTLIVGVGLLNRPAYPDIDGRERFSGPAMHTARWRQDVEIAGKRVAVIGTGASAMQLVPRIAGVAERVTIFQRTAQWGIPHPNYAREVSESTQHLMAAIPHYQAWYRLRLLWTFGDRLHGHILRDPDWRHQERSISATNDRQREFLTRYIEAELCDRVDLLAKCTPSYPPYGKRPLLDNGWFHTVTRADVELVTDPIARLETDAVVTRSGAAFPADVIVYATGFQPLRVCAPMEIRGRAGRTLRDVWGEDSAQAYLGMTVPEFPNLFCLLGPNTFAGHGGSAVLTIELQMRYVMQMLALMAERDLASVECRAAVYDAYNDELAEALGRTIWAYPGLTTYYRNSAGKIVVPMPWTNAEYWRRTRYVSAEDFELEHRHST